MIISLIGFMAAGKTTMARELSAKVGAPMIDTDAYIEEREGKTVSEIFAAVGEPGFRKIEEECLEDILEEHISEHPETLEDMHRCTLVLSLGGGIVTTPGCQAALSPPPAAATSSPASPTASTSRPTSTPSSTASRKTPVAAPSSRTAATPPCVTSSTASTASANRSMRRWPALPSEHPVSGKEMFPGCAISLSHAVLPSKEV